MLVHEQKGLTSDAVVVKQVICGEVMKSIPQIMRLRGGGGNVPNQDPSFGQTSPILDANLPAIIPQQEEEISNICCVNFSATSIEYSATYCRRIFDGEANKRFLTE